MSGGVSVSSDKSERAEISNDTTAGGSSLVKSGGRKEVFS